MPSRPKFDGPRFVILFVAILVLAMLSSLFIHFALPRLERQLH